MASKVTHIQSLVICLLFIIGNVICVDDPDLNRRAEDFILSRGFVPETHHVTTEDGYILTIHHIVNPIRRKINEEPVLIMHPLLGSSPVFMYNSPGGSARESTNFVGNNIAFELAKRGYDVWLGNVRGNIYSSKGLDLGPSLSSRNAWDFSIDEFVKYDLQTTIKHVLRQSGHGRINYIGFSQGTIIMFGLLSTHPEYTPIVKRFIAMAPVTYFNHATVPIRTVWTSPVFRLFLSTCDHFLYSAEDFKSWVDLFCPILGTLCHDITGPFIGYNTKQMNITRYPIYIKHLPAGTSCKNMLHYSQLCNSNGLYKFDYGHHRNLEKYGTITAPRYDLSRIKLNNSISLIFGANDLLGTVRNVESIRDELTVQLADYYEVPDPEWNHIDFIWGRELGSLVNKKILEILNRPIRDPIWNFG